MKTFTILFLSLLISTFASAQIQKGQFLIGGNITFESIKSEYSSMPANKSTNIFIAPDAGYFIINKLAAGLRLDIRF